MRRLFVIPLLSAALFFSGCKGDKRYHDSGPTAVQEVGTDYKSEVLAFQNALNEEFRNPESSPLADKYRKDFKGLEFFPPDSTYKVTAQFFRTPEAIPFMMPTTTERKSREVVFGIARFRLQGQNFELEIYQNQELILQEEYEDYLFLPFLDATNGTETYAGGRYIDLSVPEGNTLVIDFNKAYNPYCAYNKKYSCPLVPKVNELSIPVLAGVQAFKK